MNPTNEEPLVLTRLQRIQIADVLGEQANVIARWQSKDEREKGDHPFDVKRGLNREIRRLRSLEQAVRPKPQPEEDDDYADEQDR